MEVKRSFFIIGRNYPWCPQSYIPIHVMLTIQIFTAYTLYSYFIGADYFKIIEKFVPLKASETSYYVQASQKHFKISKWLLMNMFIHIVSRFITLPCTPYPLWNSVFFIVLTIFLLFVLCILQKYILKLLMVCAISYTWYYMCPIFIKASLLIYTCISIEV